MISKKLQRQIKSLYRLARFQKLLRILLRSAWIGGVGYLIGWGTNALWGWFPESSIWLDLGVSLAIINFLTIFYRPVSYKQFIWNLDRKMGLDEQLSAASEIDTMDDGSVNAQLIDESLSLMQDLRKRIFSKGWRLRGEIEALVIVLILFIMVFITSLGNIPSFFPGGLGFLPGLGSDPNARGIFPSGIPGVTPGDAEKMGIGQGKGDSEGGVSGLSSQELGEIGKILNEMGKELEDNASTSEFGQSLQRGDFEQAANDLNDLTENLDRLSEQTKQDLEDSFNNAADKLQQPDQQSLAESLREAADAIQSNDTEAVEKLDELASQIDALDNQKDFNSPEETKPIVGVGEPESGGANPFERLSGTGETIDLSEAGSSSTLLQPSEGVVGGGAQRIGADSTQIRPADDSVVQETIDPYSMSWDKRYEITKYFSP